VFGRGFAGKDCRPRYKLITIIISILITFAVKHSATSWKSDNNGRIDSPLQLLVTVRVSDDGIVVIYHCE
jgi:hypothetical protein